MKHKRLFDAELFVTIRGDVKGLDAPMVYRCKYNDEGDEYDVEIQLPLMDKNTRHLVAWVLDCISLRLFREFIADPGDWPF
jgi:hypothetical protein